MGRKLVLELRVEPYLFFILNLLNRFESGLTPV